MTWLLDTPVLLELLREKPNQGVLDWANTVDIDDVAVSAISVMELERIASAISASHPGTSSKIKEWLLETMKPRVQVLNVEPFAAFVAGDLQSAHASMVESLMAATAVLANLTVVTKEVADYRELPGFYVSPWT